MVVIGGQVFQRDLDFHASSRALRFMHGIDLVIHEAGHAFSLILATLLLSPRWLPFQVLLPAVCALIFSPLAQARVLRGHALLDGRERHRRRHLQGRRASAGAAPHRRSRRPAGLVGQLHLLGWTQSLARLTLAVGILLIVVALAIVANETHRAWPRAVRA
jgi:hypothetical protein